MKIPFVNRRLEGNRYKQGFNWSSDEYTKFQLVILIWRFKFYWRMRRKEAFREFTKTFKQFIYEFSFIDRYDEDGFVYLGKGLWYGFDYDQFKFKGVLYNKPSELPGICKQFLVSKKLVSSYVLDKLY